MLTVLTGTDIEGLRGEIALRLKKAEKAGNETVRITDANFSEGLVASYFGGDDLFGKTTIVVLDRVCANKNARDFIFSSLSELSSSLNDFLFFEEKLLVDDIKILEKAGGEVVTKKKAVGKPMEEFNIFALADALGLRDKKTLWTLYVQAIRAGKTPEEISGTLFWQVKSMLLVAKGEGRGLNPYVKNKAVRFIKNYTGDELQKLAYELVSEYHESRRGGLPLEGRLEKLILSL